METGKTHVRIDNRLLHGQVVQFWIPYLEVDHLIIADDEASANPAMVSVYRMAVPNRIALSVVDVPSLGETLDSVKATSLLVIVSDIADIARARNSGFECSRLTIGNVHDATGRVRITDAVYLSPAEHQDLTALHKLDKRIEIQTFPGESLRFSLDKNGGPAWSKS